MTDKYKAYIFKGIMRVKGPGVDVVPEHFNSPNTLAWILGVAYLEGFKNGKRRRSKMNCLRWAEGKRRSGPERGGGND